MRDTVFITTKPLQIMVAASIIRQLGIEKNAHLIVTDSFYGAKQVAARMKVADWSLRDLHVTFKDSIKAAYDFAGDERFKSIFIDTDVGFRKYITLAALKARTRGVHIHVYEEGLGTYRTDLYSGIRKKIFDHVGIATHFGGCIFTDGIYVFDGIRYCENFPASKANVIGLSHRIDDILTEEFEPWAHVMDYVPAQPTSATVCNIYLSSWEIDPVFIEALREMGGDIFIKPHPHLKKEIKKDFSRTVVGTAPAELVLSDLAMKYDIVNVYHHGSSVEKYIHRKNVIFIKIKL